MNYDRLEMFDEGETPETWLWCLHCERAYQLKDMRRVRGLELCHYVDCDGDTIMDAWNWNELRERRGNLPEVPEKGVMYPLYG